MICLGSHVLCLGVLFLDLEGKAGVQNPQLVGFTFHFVAHPRKSSGKIERIDIEKFILLLRYFVTQIVLVLNLENEIRNLHTSPKEDFKTLFEIRVAG